jgi:ABC-2 type transport system ATP-binding protein
MTSTTVTTALAIRCKGLTKHYGSVRALEGLDLDVQCGEIFGFLGPNGAGKTTLVRLFMGFLYPTAGGAEVLGLDPWRDAVALHARIGFLPTEIGFPEGMRGGEYLAYMARFRGGPKKSRARELADLLDLDLGRRIKELSRGNKQKLALVQAMQMESDLIILDEPTLGLDPLVSEKFHGVLRRLKEQGVTIFLSSHNLTEVQELCDRVAVLRQGRLIALESVAGLRHIQVRQYRVTYQNGDAPDVSRLDGVTVESHAGVTLTYAVEGRAVDSFVKAVAAAPVADLVSFEPSLEDVFLRFYGE